MLLYLNIILTLILGLFIGLSFKRLLLTTVFRNSLFLSSPPNNYTKVQGLRPINSDKQDMSHCFDTLEIRFINKLLEKNRHEVNVKALNAIINLTPLSAENQRQRRHLFLKELNLKLFLIFGIRESIVRLDSLEDKRIKYYVLSDLIDHEKLMTSISMPTNSLIVV